MAARIVLLSLLLASAAAHKDETALRGGAGGFVRALEFKHRLRVCNAYPNAAELTIHRGKGEELTSDGPMPYKGCMEFSSQLLSGDKLDFKVGDVSAGTFSVSDLPNNDAVLLLVIHRHDTLSSAVSFESHVFSNLGSAQVAILDAYKGAARATPRIMDKRRASNSTERSEELRYDSVVAVNSGDYDVVLMGDDGEEKARDELVALNQESYVVLRVGVDAQQGAKYAEELVVFPRSDSSMLPRSSAAQGGLAILAAFIALVTRA